MSFADLGYWPLSQLQEHPCLSAVFAGMVIACHIDSALAYWIKTVQEEELVAVVGLFGLPVGSSSCILLTVFS